MESLSFSDILFGIIIITIFIGVLLSDIRIFISFGFAVLCGMFLAIASLLSGLPFNIAVSFWNFYTAMVWPLIYFGVKEIEKDVQLESKIVVLLLRIFNKDYSNHKGGMSIENIINTPVELLPPSTIDKLDQYAQSQIDTNNTLVPYTEHDRVIEGFVQDVIDDVERNSNKNPNPELKQLAEIRIPEKPKPATINRVDPLAEWYWVREEDLVHLVRMMVQAENKMVSFRNMRAYQKIWGVDLKRYLSDVRIFLRDRGWAKDWNNGSVMLSGEGVHELTILLIDYLDTHSPTDHVSL